MKAVQIKFAPWDKSYWFDPDKLNLSVRDFVVVETNLGIELGEVVGFEDIDQDDLDNEKNIEQGSEDGEEKKREVKPVIRKATATDLNKIPGIKERKEALDVCKATIDKYELPMKLVDVHFSFDGSRVTFAFIADGRVDFRELVKELTRHFNKTIRLHQIGIRDEAKMKGDCGVCGRGLCCKSHLKDLVSITSEMAETQQLVHRGSERLSGICGRLMCCLAYEQEGYECMRKNMPPLGAKVNVDGQRGEIVGHQVLKQAVNVKFSGVKGEGPTITEVDLNRNKK